MPLDPPADTDVQLLQLLRVLRPLLIAWDRKRMGDFVGLIEEVRQIVVRTATE